MNYQESLEYLDSLSVFGVKLGLERIRHLASLMGDPQDRYNTIHVTGTNGKGSVSMLLAEVLHRSGIHAGLYTSPHLVSYTERMQVDGQPISEDEFAACATAVKKYTDQMIAEGLEPPTQFEVLTAMAFMFFSMKQVEYAVIEVGLGGLIDSTNIITPEICVITNVTMEHADKCGGTIEGIAHHKAGIIKNGVPVVTAAAGVPLEIIEETADEKNADLFVRGRDFDCEEVTANVQAQSLCFHSELLGVKSEKYKLKLLGEYQVENSALAVMTAHILHQSEPRITSETIARAMELAEWHGRFERMNIGGQQIVIDGAHNPAGMRVLRNSLDRYFPVEERVLLLGILRDKDVDAMLHLLVRANDTVIVTSPDSDRAKDPEKLAKMIHAQHVEVVRGRGEALKRALELADESRLLCVTGSLYLVGTIRQQLINIRADILKKEDA